MLLHASSVAGVGRLRLVVAATLVLLLLLARCDDGLVAGSKIVGDTTAATKGDDTIFTLSNDFVSVEWDSVSHLLVQFSRIESSASGEATATPFLSTEEIAAAATCWWQMVLVTPETLSGLPLRVNALTSGTNKSVALTRGDGYQNATFTYLIPVGTDTTNSIAVTINAMLLDTASTVEFFIRIEKNPEGSDFSVGLESASITLQGIDPTMGGQQQHAAQAAASSPSDVLVLPGGFGFLVPDPTHTYSSSYAPHYPNSDATYQSFIYYFNQTDESTNMPNGAGLFIQTHDPLGSNKIISYTLATSLTRADDPTFALGVTLYPTNAGLDLNEMGSTYVASYPIVWGTFRGDWFDGIATYRSWVLSSDAQWLSSGPVSHRTQTNTPSWLPGMNFWLNTGWQQVDIFNVTEGDPAVVLERMDRMMTILDLPSAVGLHWYEWDQIQFDTGYPNYFPAKTGFTDAVAKLHAAYGDKLKIAPYINGRIFDIGTSTWWTDSASTYASKSTPLAYNSSSLSLYLETYGSGSTFAVMCPATSYWQKKLTDVVAELRQSCGVDGIYIDQVASSQTAACSDPSHGHTIADGQSWITGYASLLDQVQSVIGGDEGNSSFIITESNSESYMAHVHIYLALVAFRINQTGFTSLVPVFPAIYGGYYLSMGAEYFLSDLTPDPDVFASKLSWQWQNGAMMGWLSLGGTNTAPKMGLFDALTTIVDDQTGALKYAAEIEWIQQLDAFRTLALGYLVDGRRSRDATFQYAPTETIKHAHEQHHKLTYAHPHRQEVRRVGRPATSGQAAPRAQPVAHDKTHHHDDHHHDHSHAHSKHQVGASATSALSDSFVYSPLQSSVWLSADSSRIAFFFSSAATNTSYTIAMSQVNLSFYGVSHATDRAWTMLQWDQHGSLVRTQKFADGTAVQYQATVEARQLLFVEFVPADAIDQQTQERIDAINQVAEE